MTTGDNTPSSQVENSGAASGERFAHFVVNRLPDGQLDVLGRGGMGVTYRAFDTQLDRPVALKVISPQWMDDPEVRSRFAREARAAARLQHPNIAAVLYQGTEGSACFYAMELVAGETLESYIKRVGPIAPVHALKLARQIALALGAAAKEGVLHRDLKPGNIMLTRYSDDDELHAKVIDFGLAKVLSDVPASYTTGGFVGTPGFASPEQCSEEELDSRSDLYSLGATLWFMVAGRPPFSGSLLAVIQAQAVEPPPFVELGAVPTPLRIILERLLAKFPDERPATPTEAVHEIEVVLEALEEKGDGFHPLGVAPAPAVARVQSRARPSLLSSAQPPPPSSQLLPVTIGIAVVATGAALFFAGRSSTAPRVASSPQTHLAATPAAGVPIEWVNSIGMKFVRVPTERVQMSVWETRVRDFETFVKAANYQEADRPDPDGHTWRQPGFPQDPDHPVVNVTLNDAIRFCQWLTQKERAAGRIASNQSYRLPTRLEWDQSTGFPMPRDANRPDSNQFTGAGFFPPQNGGGPGGPPPAPGNGMAAFPGQPPGFQPPAGQPPGGQPPGGQPPNGAPPMAGSRPGLDGRQDLPGPGDAAPPFIWGTPNWPPESSTGNYADSAAFEKHAVPGVIAGYRDGWAYTAPGGRFRPNQLGIFDLSGNVWEIVTDRPDGASQFMMLGGSWQSASQEDLRLHTAKPLGLTQRNADLGFRCVLAD